MNDEKVLEAARKLVKEQAENEGLWFDADYITEALLQQELRKLHSVIENDSETDYLDDA